MNGLAYNPSFVLRNCGGLVCVAACFSYIGPAEAQTPDQRAVEEVIVTAQKRSERQQEVPVPVTAIQASALAERSQLQLQDYYTKVPGLGLAMVGDGDAPAITIRGITTGGLSNPTVGVVIDDVPYGGTIITAAPPAAPEIDPGDLQQIEVLRGPQGTLYGASSMGGLLKYVTVDPSMERLSGRLQMGASSVKDGETGYNLRGGINVPINDMLALRASAFQSVEPGYIDNVTSAEEDVNRRESDGGRLSAMWRPSDAFSMKLSALVQSSDRRGGGDVNISLGDLEQSTVRGSGGYSRDTHAYSAILEGTVGAIELTSVTGYSVDELTTAGDATSLGGGIFSGVASALFGVPGVVSETDRRTEKVSQELRASLPIGDSVNWLIGAFYTDEEATGTSNIVAADPISGQRVGPIYTNDSPTTFEEYAFFTNFTFKINDRFDVQVGGRLSENEQTLSAIRGGPLAVAFFGSSPSIVPELDVTDDKVFTYLVTPRFRMSPHLMMYARVASGYRPGGVNLGCGLTPCTVDPDTTENYEVGMKGDVANGAFTFDASLYYIDWKDIQLLLLQNGFGYQANGSRGRSQGMEVSMDAAVTSGLTISAWIAFNDAELTEDLPPTSLYAGREGDRLPYSSRWSGNLSIDQIFPLGTSITGSAGASVSYVDQREGTFQAGTLRETFPSYTQVDLHVGMKYDTLTLNAFLNNATDRRGVLRGGLDAADPLSFTYTIPRTIGVSLGKSF